MPSYHGALDVITPDGFIEGWAWDREDDYDTPIIDIVHDGEVIATGPAHRFRADLLDAGVGHGWYGFRCRPARSFEIGKSYSLTLVARKTGEVVAGPTELEMAEDSEPGILSVADILHGSGSPIIVSDQLKGTIAAIRRFIATNGVEQFVDYGYCYVLGRPADPGGLRNYARLIAEEALAPLRFLSELIGSEERRASSWRMIPPSDPAFPFKPVRKPRVLRRR
jgi:hypothetical protein